MEFRNNVQRACIPDLIHVCINKKGPRGPQPLDNKKVTKTSGKSNSASATLTKF